MGHHKFSLHGSSFTSWRFPAKGSGLCLFVPSSNNNLRASCSPSPCLEKGSGDGFGWKSQEEKGHWTALMTHCSTPAPKSSRPAFHFKPHGSQELQGAFSPSRSQQWNEKLKKLFNDFSRSCFCCLSLTAWTLILAIKSKLWIMPGSGKFIREQELWKAGSKSYWTASRNVHKNW